MRSRSSIAYTYHHGALVQTYSGPCTDAKYTEGFNQQSVNGLYEYDAGGNMTYDPNKKLTFYYNYHNLPYRIVGAENDQLQLLYGADGSLLQRKYLKNNIIITKTDYLRGVEYKSDTLSPCTTLMAVPSRAERLDVRILDQRPSGQCQGHLQR
ncbi:MAG: hypothetical protein IPJ13_28050 [Saprospiraceae bacterium]|nr:hypothetical protein [Saprospiraceae bacterium]